MSGTSRFCCVLVLSADEASVWLVGAVKGVVPETCEQFSSSVSDKFIEVYFNAYSY
jgi:hypothetical protein